MTLSDTAAKKGSRRARGVIVARPASRWSYYYCYVFLPVAERPSRRVRGERGDSGELRVAQYSGAAHSKKSRLPQWRATQAPRSHSVPVRPTASGSRTFFILQCQWVAGFFLEIPLALAKHLLLALSGHQGTEQRSKPESTIHAAAATQASGLGV